MRLGHLRAFRSSASGRSKLRHAARRGHHAVSHWLYYSRSSPFSRASSLLQACMRAKPYTRRASHRLKPTRVQPEPAEINCCRLRRMTYTYMFAACESAEPKLGNIGRRCISLLHLPGQAIVDRLPETLAARKLGYTLPSLSARPIRSPARLSRSGPVPAPSLTCLTCILQQANPCTRSKKEIIFTFQVYRGQGKPSATVFSHNRRLPQHPKNTCMKSLRF
jgi:hypothetical protein